MCLSLLQYTDSVSLLSGATAATFNPGNLSKHVTHLETLGAPCLKRKSSSWSERVAVEVVEA